MGKKDGEIQGKLRFRRTIAAKWEKKDGGIKGEPYSRRIIETSGENKEFDKFRFVYVVPFRRQAAGDKP